MFILLSFCTDGMSTSLLAYRMESAAKACGLECRIEAHHFNSISEFARDADIIMIAPQERFQYNNLKKLYSPKPIVVIDVKNYGTMNGEKVLEQARHILGK